MFQKSLHLFLIFSPIFLFACGGGGGGNNGDDDMPLRVTISTSVSANGTISPTSATLDQGGSFSFTLAPDSEYNIDSVSGCGGTLTGNSYSTGPVNADCTITASFAEIPITSFELIDPTPGVNDQFGSQVVILTNGHIVVTDPFDSSRATNGGAVHLYNPITQTLIASLYGDSAEDQLGSGGITPLGNGHFVITSPFVDLGDDTNAGTVQLINGDSGEQIGIRQLGDANDDRLGSGGITVLANNNYVISSPGDDTVNKNDAGSARLMNGSSGAQIGNDVTGNDDGDKLGSGGITALANNNFVVSSPEDDVFGNVDAGSVRLINSATAVQIGTAQTGDTSQDQMGSGGVTALANNNFVISSPEDDVGDNDNAGSVRLIDGSTGAQIDSDLTGNASEDQLGSGGITALANDNFVISSPFDDVFPLTNAGSVRLVNGATGKQIGALTGNANEDQLGRGGIIALGNFNAHYVVVSPFENDGINFDAGSVRLINGNDASVVGNPVIGENANDFLGSNGVTALANNFYVIASPEDDENAVMGKANAGSVRLVDGDTGIQINSLIGDVVDKKLGSGVVTALVNNNFVLSNHLDDVNNTADVGSVSLFNGETGVLIGTPLVGSKSGDALGFNGVTALATGNYVVASSLEDFGSLDDLGSVRLLDGSNATQDLNALRQGTVFQDFNSVTVTPSDVGDFYIIAAPRVNNNGMTDSGLVQLVVP